MMPALFLSSHFLYAISRPGKTGIPQADLSEDQEASLGDNPPALTGQQLAIERIIAKVFVKYNISIPITDGIRSVFQTKLWRMGQKMSKLGGRGRKQLIEEWKTSTWQLTIATDKQLLHQKRSLEVQLQNESSKRQKLESDAIQLRKVVREQEETIASLRKGEGKGRGLSSSKTWSDYSRQHQHRKRKAIAKDIKALCKGGCFTPVSIEVSHDSGKEIIDLAKGTAIKSREEKSCEELMPFALFVKDKFTLSDAAYHEISQLTSSLPCLSKLRTLASSVNSDFDIRPAPNGTIGVQQGLATRLLPQLQMLKNLKPDDIVKIKLTGDGTNIGRSVHVVNIAFTLLNDTTTVSSPFGNHSLAILEIPEDYDSLKEGLADILSEAGELKQISVNGNTHDIEYFLGGDMKFLNLVCGIEAANGKYSCLWCKCPSSERFDTTITWSAFNPLKGARTNQEIEDLLKKPKAQRMGCNRSPLFKFIPIDHVIIDMLHLFLRIADLLINLLIQDLRRHDGIVKATTELNREKHVGITAYESYLNNHCKIKFQWYTCKETKQLKWRDLTGPEKVRLFNNLDFVAELPLQQAASLQDLWKEFWRLFTNVEKYDTTTELQSDIKNWVKLFLKQYQTKNITPYVHAFVNHVPEFIEKYGSVCQFNQQGLEKLNDITTQHYLRASNHRNTEALKQVLEKRNRLEELENGGYKRPVQPRHCGICGSTTHNRRKCLQSAPLQPLSSPILNLP